MSCLSGSDLIEDKESVLAKCNAIYTAITLTKNKSMMFNKRSEMNNNIDLYHYNRYIVMVFQ